MTNNIRQLHLKLGIKCYCLLEIGICRLVVNLVSVLLDLLILLKKLVHRRIVCTFLLSIKCCMMCFMFRFCASIMLLVLIDL